MKKQWQGLLAGIIIGALITGSVAFAANATTLYDVLVGGIKIVIDGKELHPTDANGKPVEPIIYNGTTYLPVRAVAGALDKAVYWDGPTFTVYLGNMKGKLDYPTVELEKMTSIGDRPKSTDSLTDNYDTKYSRAIQNCAYSTDFEYLLNMKYSRFKGTLYIPKGETKGYHVRLTIEADGKTIYTSPDMTKASYPVDIDVSVKGYNDVRIYFSDRYDGVFSNVPMLCLADAGFYQ